MSGTIPLSMSQQLDVYGKPLSGGQLYIIQVGTVSTPQDAFQDTALAIKHPYPMTLDAAGRIPQFFLADGSVKIRLQDKFGVVQLASDNVLVIGPSSGGGGGGGAVDATQLIQVGNLIFRYGIGDVSGYVRANGRSIGNAISGGTERQNADTQALFLHLYGQDTSLVLKDSGGSVVGRTTAANDFGTLNRNLALPDFRGYALGALDDMGNTAAGRLTASYFGAAATVLGAAGGVENITITTAQIPSHYHAAGIFDPTHAHGTSISGGTLGATGSNGVQGGGTFTGATSPSAIGVTVSANGTGVRVNSSNGVDTTYSAGGSTPFRVVQPTKLVTFYLKL